MVSIGFLLMILMVGVCRGLSTSRIFEHMLINSNNSTSKYLTKDVIWFNQTLDHFSPFDHRKFGQRYYEYLDEFRVPDGPIFLKICGESACGGIQNDYISVLAKKFGAAVVTLEHRTNVENPWFVFGVSYAGALSAWFRLKFPHLTCGSLASSGVVLAVYNFTEFDQQVGESAGPECKAVLQEITQLVEEKLASNPMALKATFGATELKIDGDFLYFLADAAAIAFQYGNPDKLCTPITEAKKAGDDLVNAYAKYIKEYYVGSFGAEVQTYNQESLKHTTLSDSSGDRLWWFQVCTEVAYFQVAPTNDSIRSSKVDTRHIQYIPYHLDLCKNVFGEGVYPLVDATNLYYGGTDIAVPSYIITCENCGHGTDLRGCPQSPLVPEGNSKNCSSPDAVNKVRQQMIEQIDLWLSQCQAANRLSS
ncbi:hypothetical protein M8C21_025701 [Ambrosia artemisiifolia]|uniref:Serine protease EDA2 n=1 Tax=Ambrosia artemisiifolia TaxID=4212 RepID=A0AAD5GDP2_AMBAR|nr:hypothetical protein M8C21_025701 [Ambrosia artemisiifolia]